MDRTETTICGHNCIEIYLRALKESGLKTETSLLRYGQSYQVTDMYDTSVSYCHSNDSCMRICLFYPENGQRSRRLKSLQIGHLMIRH